MSKSDKEGRYFVLPEDQDALSEARDAAVVAAKDMQEDCEDGWSYWAHIYTTDEGYRVGILVEDSDGLRLGIIKA